MGGNHNQAMSTTLARGTVRLHDWGVISATGADAAKFLHSQLTQDIEGLAVGQSTLAGYCSAKGRLLATFVVWRAAADEFLLACSADVLPGVLKRLQMFVLRAKCKLADASTQWPLAGVVGDAPASFIAALPDSTVPHDGARVGRWLCRAEGDAGDLPHDDWLALEARSGVVRVVAATAEQFVPQMVNLELTGGVNFKKGCYPGQEVVARSQYRGTTKRRALVFECDAPLAPGQEVFDANDAGQPAGMVVLAGRIGGRTHALVEVKLAAIESPLHAGSAAGPRLQPATLPYDLPLDAAA
jgi:folate-binding protein YgfZ